MLASTTTKGILKLNNILVTSNLLLSNAPIIGIGNLGSDDKIIISNTTTYNNTGSTISIEQPIGSVVINNSILQESNLSKSNLNTNKLTLNNCYLKTSQQYSEVRNNCIVGSDPKFVSSTDLRLYSDTLVPITTSTEIDKYNTKYEQYVDLNNTPYNRNYVVAGAYQELLVRNTSNNTTNNSTISGATVTDALNNLQTQILANTGGTEQSIISDTYNNIKQLVDSNSLIPESTYIITDYQTKHLIPNSDPQEINIGNIEPLTLIAATTNTFYIEVKSSLFPSDIIHYRFDDDSCEDGTRDVESKKWRGGTIRPGYIQYRKSILYKPLKYAALPSDERNPPCS